MALYRKIATTPEKKIKIKVKLSMCSFYKTHKLVLIRTCLHTLFKKILKCEKSPT